MPIRAGSASAVAVLARMVVAGACAYGLGGLSPAAAQFQPVSGQQSSVFPPPPPPPGQAAAQPAQDPAFPPPPSPGRAAPASGGFGAPQGSFGPAPQNGFGPASGAFGSPAPRGGFGAAPQSGPNAEAQRVCSTFPSLREDVEKGALAIKSAGERKMSREEVCPLFKTFAAREAKMLNFLEKNRTLCGVPPNIIKQLKGGHANTIRIRNQVCSAAPVGPAAAPTLSDALGGPLIADDESARKPGRGTFDTLTGNALSR